MAYNEEDNKMEAPVKKKVSNEKKEKLKRFINGFKNENKIDTYELSKEVRGKNHDHN
jgi:hypothetical protein